MNVAGKRMVKETRIEFISFFLNLQKKLMGAKLASKMATQGRTYNYPVCKT